MFFRRPTTKKLTFPDYLGKARTAGFTVEELGGGKAKVSRNGVAAIIEDVPGGPPKFAETAGIVIGNEIARLVDGGYQKFIQTPSGKRRAALASDLRAIHNFQEDLREALCIPGAYNEALGTVSNQYVYDRVEHRDEPAPKEPWEQPIFLKTKA
jgi:hypothetical protein